MQPIKKSRASFSARVEEGTEEEPVGKKRRIVIWGAIIPLSKIMRKNLKVNENKS